MVQLTDQKTEQKTRQELGVIRRLAATRPATEGRRLRAPVVLTDLERAELVTETLLSLCTIERWARGLRVLTATEIRLKKAMQKLGIVPRPKPQRAA